MEVKVRPLALEDMAGVVFRYHTNRHYYLFSLTDGKTARLRLRLPIEKKMRAGEWKELGSVPFPYDATRYYTLKVENDGPRIRAYIDGKLLIEAADSEILKGKAGIRPTSPRASRISASAHRGRRRKSRFEARIARARRRSWPACATTTRSPSSGRSSIPPNFGAGRNVRFGDLDGDGVPDMLIAQNVRKVAQQFLRPHQLPDRRHLRRQGALAVGPPRPLQRRARQRHAVPDLTTSTATARTKSSLVKDFKIQVLDGTHRQAAAVGVDAQGARGQRERPYELESRRLHLLPQPVRRQEPAPHPDQGPLPHLLGLQQRARSCSGRGQGNLGHYPYPLDIDGDGREEIIIGYALWSPDGKQLWSHDNDTRADHSDGVVIGNFSGEPDGPAPRLRLRQRRGFHHVRPARATSSSTAAIGHTQSPAVGKFRTDLPGLQLMSVNFWRNPGIVTLFDAEGNILAQEEPIHSGSPMLPVNWRGDGQEFVLLSGEREGRRDDRRSAAARGDVPGRRPPGPRRGRAWT